MSLLADLRQSVARFIAPAPSKSATAAREARPQGGAESVAWAEVSAIAAQHKYNPDDLIGRKGFDIYKRMMCDEQVKCVTHFKRSTITGREWQFELDAKKHRLSESEARRRVDLMTASIEVGYSGSFVDGLNAIMKADWQGFSFTEQNFGTFEHDEKTWWCVRELRPKPFDTFFPVVNDKGDVLRWTQKSPRGADVTLDVSKFVYHRCNPDMDEHYGHSNLRAAYRPYLSKDIAIRFRNIFMERLAGGFPVITPKEGYGLVRGDSTWNALTDILKSLTGKSGVLLPEGFELEIVQSSGGQVSTFKEAIDQDDLAIARSALVPNLLGVSPSGQTGSYSQADTQFDVFMIVSNTETRRLEETLNEQMFAPLGRATFADGIVPRFCFKPLSKRQTAQIMEMWTKLLSSGAAQASETDEAHLRKMMEFPVKGELLVDPAAAAPSTPPTSTPVEGERDERRPVGRGDDSDEERDAGKKRAMRRARFHGSPGDPNYPHEGGREGGAAEVDEYLGGLKEAEDWGEGYRKSPIPFKSTTEAQRADIKAMDLAVRTKWDTASVPVSSLVSRQKAIQEEKVRGLLSSKVPDGDEKYPLVYQTKDGDNIVLDGNHRIVRDMAQGAKHVKVRVVREGEGKMRASRSSFAISRAEARVAFSVIERQTTTEHERHVVAVEDALADVVTEALARAPVNEEEAGKFTLDGNKVRGVESAVRRMLKAGMDIGVDHAKREVARARKRFERIDMQRLGDMAGEWLRQKSFTITGDIQAGAVREIRNSLVRGLKFNWGHERVKEDVYKTLVKKGFLGGRSAAQALGVGDKDRLAELLELKTGLEPHRLDTVVRTNMFEAVNEARFNTFTDPVLGDFVRGFEYSAVLDSRTTQICEHLDGKKYARERWEGDLRSLVPPNHFNCRSLLVPITAVDEDAEFDEGDPGVEPQEGFGE